MPSVLVPTLPLPPQQPNRADDLDWLDYVRALVAHWSALVAYHTAMLEQTRAELARLEQARADRLLGGRTADGP